MVVISATWGRLPRVSGSSLSKDAAISGKAAFLAPPTVISPLRRLPPRMRILSMKLPMRPLARLDDLFGFYLMPVGASSPAPQARPVKGGWYRLIFGLIRSFADGGR